jgi:pimeloyl-ACP methyl ester carboxylesterase
MTESLYNVFPPRTANAIAIGALAYGIARISQSLLRSRSTSGITKSPLKALVPTLSEQAKAQLPYPTDALPGARDVSSPYGSIRVYEWGPESGKKVLLVHGISTPCLALGAVAHALVDRGCRVMLFDLYGDSLPYVEDAQYQAFQSSKPEVADLCNRFGRGFSDNPNDLPQDSRLFCSQILICLASSSLSWTGSASGRFALIGYSLGGGISASFTFHFPDLVSSLVLISPSGLLRQDRVSLRTKILYSQGVLPEPILTYLVRKRLQGSVPPPRTAQPNNVDTRSNEPVKLEAPKHESSSMAALSRSYPELTTVSVVKFQVEHHQAFVQAYMSSIRHGPIMMEHTKWKSIGQRLSMQNQAEKSESIAVGLDRSKVLIICGDADTSIVSSDLVPDATDAFDGNVEFRHLDAGHDVPISKSGEVAAAIWEFWSG